MSQHVVEAGPAHPNAPNKGIKTLKHDCLFSRVSSVPGKHDSEGGQEPFHRAATPTVPAGTYCTPFHRAATPTHCTW
jgi:hypothetical protein